MNDPQSSNDSANASTIDLAPDQLRALVQKIELSGALGRSKVYADLLRYLCENAVLGVTPKEVVIAIDVLGKDSDFDAKNDSLVRVYMHKLRQKLDYYYQHQGQTDEYQLEIPVGRYTLSVACIQPKTEKDESSPTASPKKTANYYLIGALSAFSILLVANLFTLSDNFKQERSQLSALVELSENPVWEPILADSAPVLIVIGDYYIFGEQGEAGNADRLVREYHINSPKDLERHLSEAENQRTGYYNLNLFYTPRAIAFALRDILPVLTAAGKTVNIRMNSDLKAPDLKSNHILYIGYISAMRELQSLAFGASTFAVGSSYDELVHIDTGKRHVSEEIDPSENSDTFVDYGMISSFPTLSGHQMMVISGTRDTGLMHMAQIVANNRYLSTISNSIKTPNHDAEAIAFEAFYRVIGFDGTNFDAEQIHIGNLEYSRIWGGEMMEIVK